MDIFAAFSGLLQGLVENRVDDAHLTAWSGHEEELAKFILRGPSDVTEPAPPPTLEPGDTEAPVEGETALAAEETVSDEPVRDVPEVIVGDESSVTPREPAADDEKVSANSEEGDGQ